ncbi:MAG: hypothetical protein LQ342_002737 [Letrouitia transgressa]|nr:MAG: hypothetical protein LQ342_002737 [Letrouitia transgressa]
MGPRNPLPFSSEFTDAEAYIDSLLSFVVSSSLFQTLCGGVHILEFFINEPDIYSTILPLDWRVFFALHDISDIIDLLTRENLDLFSSKPKDDEGDATEENSQSKSRENRSEWRGNSTLPPPSLVEYIRLIRIHNLNREVELPDGCLQVTPAPPPLARHVSVGMKPKKIHEVEHLARYVTDLSIDISSKTPYSISHFVDFGSGQNYLGRALASQPYCRRVVAIESKSSNIDGARGMDVTAKLAKKQVVMRNKKEYRREEHRVDTVNIPSWPQKFRVCNDSPSRSDSKVLTCADEESKVKNESNIQYVQTIIQNGDLSLVVDKVKSIPQQSQSQQSNTKPHLMVISLHSCGNLLHHGLRSLILNPSVKAVAMVGCCYNLITERLSPPTYKLPSLRLCTPRLEQTSSACDPHGFPMSERLAHYQHAHGPGIRFNITPRMMAVQAPQNWTETDCESFFTRHFYRALLQKILVDRGFFEGNKNSDDIMGRHDPQKLSRAGHPIVIGSLRKACYASFQSYVRGAVAKLKDAPLHREQVTRCMADISNEEIARYEDAYRERKKELSVVWSLMAFSATVVESVIVVDRWQYLREQQEVRDCWVEAAFEYKQSPRNFVVVGIKR